MSNPEATTRDRTQSSIRTRRPSWGRLRQGATWGCATIVAAFFALVAALYVLFANAVPKSFPLVENPIPPPESAAKQIGSLDGFSSPYIGHTGSWDGKGGAMFGASKIPDLDMEASIGLRWTFMCVYWSAMEPDGAVDLGGELPPAWKSLDEFVIAAHERKLNILMQAPVVGGNAGGPPNWAGRRETGKSAPRDMDSLVAFAGKLADRYSPGGTLAQQQGWQTDYGVRAWEMDNEPESYRTNWKGQAGDYAEFVTKASACIKEADPQALILTPAASSGSHAEQWVRDALDAESGRGSAAFRVQGEGYSIGPSTDVVSFHNYEGLDSFFAGEDFPVTRAFGQVRSAFEDWENRSSRFEYQRKCDYWHTEGNFDFLGVLSEKRRAAWRFQFFTRAFAAGIRKVAVMDAKPLEQTAVRTYIDVLPDPFPMIPATDQLRVVNGHVCAFRHPGGPEPDARQVWVVWAAVGTGDSVVEIPIIRESAEVFTVEGLRKTIQAADGRIRLPLRGDPKMPPPVLVVDQA